MSKDATILRKMRSNPAGVRFNELAKLCDAYFGVPRQAGTSHRIYKTPWSGDPRVNIQSGKGGMGKVYQVRQVLLAIDEMEGLNNDRKG